MLTGPFREGVRESGLYKLSAEDWDAEALFIVLSRIHANHKAVPDTVDLETLTQISIIIDYYACHDVLHGRIDRRLEKLCQPALPFHYNANSLKWLFIGQVWSSVEIIRPTVLLVMEGADVRIETALPISSTILGTSSGEAGSAPDT
jgi:hypothetical protein